jgi:anhydro-N-acetylmuramic acid kinase
VGEYAELLADLTDLHVDVCSQLIGRAGLDSDAILAIGLSDWLLESRFRGAAPSAISLCDAARLAAATGLPVIDGFPAADLARRGGGAPLAPLPLWLLLARRNAPDAKPFRLLWELGRQSRFTLLPPFSDAGAESIVRRIRFARGPGLAPIDRLTQQLTAGAERFDPGGRLGAQGRLRDQWLAPWSEFFGNDESIISRDTLPNSPATLHDALRLATHALAATLAERVTNFVGGRFSEVEIVLAGGGRRNGLLLREIIARLPAEAAIHPLTEYGLRDESLSPAVAAILALFFIDRVAGNLPHITGSDASRVLGRLTPGNPATLRRLLLQMSARTPETQKLRDAM